MVLRVTISSSVSRAATRRALRPSSLRVPRRGPSSDPIRAPFHPNTCCPNPRLGRPARSSRLTADVIEQETAGPGVCEQGERAGMTASARWTRDDTRVRFGDDDAITKLGRAASLERACHVSRSSSLLTLTSESIPCPRAERRAGVTRRERHRCLAQSVPAPPVDER